MTAPLHPESLSWAALLGRWLDLAAASTALTEAQDGPQWRASIPSLVTLQAVVCASSPLLLRIAGRAKSMDRAAAARLRAVARRPLPS